MEQGNNPGERASLVERAIERMAEPSVAPAPSAVQAIEARDEDMTLEESMTLSACRDIERLGYVPKESGAPEGCVS